MQKFITIIVITLHRFYTSIKIVTTLDSYFELASIVIDCVFAPNSSFKEIFLTLIMIYNFLMLAKKWIETGCILWQNKMRVKMESWDAFSFLRIVIVQKMFSEMDISKHGDDFILRMQNHWKRQLKTIHNIHRHVK